LVETGLVLRECNVLGEKDAASATSLITGPLVSAGAWASVYTLAKDVRLSNFAYNQVFRLAAIKCDDYVARAALLQAVWRGLEESDEKSGVTPVLGQTAHQTAHCSNPSDLSCAQRAGRLLRSVEVLVA